MTRKMRTSSGGKRKVSKINDAKNKKNRVAPKKRQRRNVDESGRKRKVQKIKEYKSVEFLPSSDDEDADEMMDQTGQIGSDAMQQADSQILDPAQNTPQVPKKGRRGRKRKTVVERVEPNMQAKLAEDVVANIVEAEVGDVEGNNEENGQVEKKDEEEERPSSNASSVICLGEIMPLKFKNPIRHVHKHLKLSKIEGPQGVEWKFKEFTGIVEDTASTMIVSRNKVEPLKMGNITTMFLEIGNEEDEEQQGNNFEDEKDQDNAATDDSALLFWKNELLRQEAEMMANNSDVHIKDIIEKYKQVPDIFKLCAQYLVPEKNTY